MNQDNRKNNATKHYQNSDYPSGSFEAAINADHKDRLSEPTGLRLERHPLAPGNSGADLEEMVPAFMHRDFFRSEEDAVEAVAGNSRLRAARKAGAPEEGYQEPPNTEEAAALAPPRSPYAPPVDEPAPLRGPAQARTDGPLSSLRSSNPTPDLRSASPRPEPASGPSPRPEPASGPSPRPEPTNGPSPRPEPTSGPSPRPEPTSGPSPRPEPTNATYPPTVVEPGSQPGANKSPYSVPMLVALAVIVGIFAWREQTRPTVVVQEPLAVPKTALASPTSAPLAEPTPAGTGFRPTYLAVGPPVPQEGLEETGASPTPAASGEPEGVAPTEEGEQASSGDQAESDERAAILERMSQASGSSEASSSAPVGEPGELFPTEGEEETAASPPKAPVREAGSKSDPHPRPAESKPAAKAEPKPVPVSATAADLFPIDEEVPIRSSKTGGPPAGTVPLSAPAQPAAAPAGDPPPDGYRIDEPNL